MNYKEEIQARMERGGLEPEYDLQPGDYEIADLAAKDPMMVEEGRSMIQIANLGPDPQMDDPVAYKRVPVAEYEEDPTGFVYALSFLVGDDPEQAAESVRDRSLPEPDLRSLVGEGYSADPRQVDYLADLVEGHVRTANEAAEGWRETGTYYPVWIDRTTHRIIDGNHRAAAFVAEWPEMEPLTWVSEL